MNLSFAQILSLLRKQRRRITFSRDSVILACAYVSVILFFILLAWDAYFLIRTIAKENIQTRAVSHDPPLAKEDITSAADAMERRLREYEEIFSQ